MNQPRISLIIPAYNEEKYVGQCLEAIRQHAGNLLLEVILVDNMSTDHTREVASKYPEVKILSEEKRSPSFARQRGFQEARGEILAYMDADTKMPPGWCEQIEMEFSRDPNLACLSGPYTYYDFSPLQSLLAKIFWYFIAKPSYYFTGYLVIGGNFAIRRSVLEKMNGIDTSIAFYGDDTDIGRRASQFGKVKFKLGFFMPTSGRRLVGQGFLNTVWLYITNFLSEVFVHRPVTKDYTNIR